MNSAELGELFIQLAFQGNTEEAEKFKKTMNETAKAMQKTAEKAKESAKSQNKDTDETKNNNKSKIGTIKALGGYIAAISGAIFAVKKLTDSLIEENKTWLNLTRTSDIALSTFQKWDSVGEMYGVDGAAQSIKNLNDRLFELKLTGANAQGFILAGIRPTNSEDVMEQLRARVSGLSDTSAAYLLRQIGLDENLLHILRLSRSEFEALNAEMQRFRLTVDQRKDIREMNVQLQIAGQKLKYLKDRVIIAIMPHFIRFIQNMEFIAEQAANLIKQFSKLSGGIKLLTVGFVALITKIKPAVKFLSVSGGAIAQMITKIPVLGRLFVGLGGIISRALLPLTILYFLIDDIRAYMTGGGSMIGVIEYALKKIKENGLEDTIQKLENVLNFPVPEWIKALSRGTDRLHELVMFNSPEFKDLLETTAERIKVRMKNAKPEDIEIFKALTNKDLLKYGSLEAAFEAKAGYKLPAPYINPFTTTTNNRNIQFNQNNTFNTNQPAQEIYNSLLPLTEQLKFANNNLTPRFN